MRQTMLASGLGQATFPANVIATGNVRKTSSQVTGVESPQSEG